MLVFTRNRGPIKRRETFFLINFTTSWLHRERVVISVFLVNSGIIFRGKNENINTKCFPDILKFVHSFFVGIPLTVKMSTEYLRVSSVQTMAVFQTIPAFVFTCSPHSSFKFSNFFLSFSVDFK